MMPNKNKSEVPTSKQPLFFCVFPIKMISKPFSASLNLMCLYNLTRNKRNYSREVIVVGLR